MLVSLLLRHVRSQPAPLREARVQHLQLEGVARKLEFAVAAGTVDRETLAAAGVGATPVSSETTFGISSDRLTAGIYWTIIASPLLEDLEVDDGEEDGARLRLSGAVIADGKGATARVSYTDQRKGVRAMMQGRNEHRFRQQAELGRLLSDAVGYCVLGHDGHERGVLEHVRYTQHADHPDELILRRRWFWNRHVVVPFSDVVTVDRASRTIRLREMS